MMVTYDDDDENINYDFFWKYLHICDDYIMMKTLIIIFVENICLFVMIKTQVGTTRLAQHSNPWLIQVLYGVGDPFILKLEV